MHTTASDGSDTPREVVRKAARLGLMGLSITDHDTVAGLAEGEAEAGRVGIRFIPGIELTSDAETAEVHVLGYHIDYRHATLLAKLEEVKTGRIERAKEMVRRVRALGVDLTWEEVWSVATERGFIGRGHLFRVMTRKGLVPRDAVGETFRRLFAKGGLAYVEHYYLRPDEAVAVIREAGGVPVLAHPGRMPADELIEELVRSGLMGIEAYYPTHDPGTTAHYLMVAQRLGLVATGGTDYHGRFTEHAVAMGTFSAPPSVLTELSRAAAVVREGVNTCLSGSVRKEE